MADAAVIIAHRPLGFEDGPGVEASCTAAAPASWCDCRLGKCGRIDRFIFLLCFTSRQLYSSATFALALVDASLNVFIACDPPAPTEFEFGPSATFVSFILHSGAAALFVSHGGFTSTQARVVALSSRCRHHDTIFFFLAVPRRRQARACPSPSCPSWRTSWTTRL